MNQNGLLTLAISAHSGMEDSHHAGISKKIIK